MTIHTPNLPALIDALPGDHTRAPQTEFTRARQVRFLENLSLSGSARSAASAAGVSHQTAYRMRRSTPEFRTAWDGAMLAARVHAEDVLACRAIDGVEEKVFYHGEQVDTRVRYSDRLLLAHLGRLDRLAGDARVNAVAEDFDAALARFAAGEDLVAPEPAPEISSPGPCNTRSMSPASAEEWDDEDDDEDDGGDGIDWEDEAAAEAELARIEAAMEADRPAGAPRLTGTGPDGEPLDPGGVIADAQWQAFEAGVPRWWLVVPPVPEGDGDEWEYADPDRLAAAGGGADHAGDDEDWNDAEAEDWEDEPDEDSESDEDEEEADDLAADDLPEEAPPMAAPPPARGVTRGPWAGALPIDDGRCTRFYGRVWDR